MGFIFRTIFWLSLALVAVPPQARLGGQDTADFRDVDLEQELHAAMFAAWSWTSGMSASCDANPQLCHAAAGLWDTTWKTIGNLADYRATDTTTQLADAQPSPPKNGGKTN